MKVDFKNITTAAHVETYGASHGIFEALLQEVKELSRKKPEATMSASKVKIVNRVLIDLLVFLKGEPEGKYLDELDDEALPQVSDAVLVMVQFETALKKYVGRYVSYVPAYNERAWITKELVAELEKLPDEDEEPEDDELEGDE